MKKPYQPLQKSQPFSFSPVGKDNLWLLDCVLIVSNSHAAPAKKHGENKAGFMAELWRHNLASICGKPCGKPVQRGLR